MDVGREILGNVSFQICHVDSVNGVLSARQYVCSTMSTELFFVRRDCPAVLLRHRNTMNQTAITKLCTLNPALQRNNKNVLVNTVNLVLRLLVRSYCVTASVTYKRQLRRGITLNAVILTSCVRRRCLTVNTITARDGTTNCIVTYCYHTPLAYDVHIINRNRRIRMATYAFTTTRCCDTVKGLLRLELVAK